MLSLTPASKEYATVTIGSTVVKNGDVYIKCALCGQLCSGETQQDQIDKLFQCLGTHIPPEHVFEIYEQRGKSIVTSINKAAWDKAKKRTKFK